MCTIDDVACPVMATFPFTCHARRMSGYPSASDLLAAMSGIYLISSGVPPGSDVADALRVR
jgi:hypothetical protein